MKHRPTCWLNHPQHGELPAARLIECVFALAPNGRILHHHLEEMTVSELDDEVHYHLGASTPLPERSRCQVIPPLVNSFPRRPRADGDQ